MVPKGLTPLLVLALSYLPCFWSAVRVHPSNTPWTGAFPAKFSIESNTTHTPWTIHIIFEVPVEHVDFWHGTITKVNDYEYVLSDLGHEQDLQSGKTLVYIDFQAHTPGVKASPDTVICAYVAGHEPDSVCPRNGGYTLPPTAAPQTFTPAQGGFVTPSHGSGETGRPSVSIDAHTSTAVPAKTTSIPPAISTSATAAVTPTPTPTPAATTAKPAATTATPAATTAKPAATTATPAATTAKPAATTAKPAATTAKPAATTAKPAATTAKPAATTAKPAATTAIMDTTVETSTMAVEKSTTPILTSSVASSVTTPLATVPTTTEATSTTQVESTSPPILRKCAQCGDVFTEVPCSEEDLKLNPSLDCPSNAHFCMNHVFQNGTQIRRFKTCVEESTCELLWYRGTSDKSLCLHYDPTNNIYDLVCHFCCVGDNCNLDDVPPHQTWYRS